MYVHQDLMQDLLPTTHRETTSTPPAPLELGPGHPPARGGSDGADTPKRRGYPKSTLAL